MFSKVTQTFSYTSVQQLSRLRLPQGEITFKFETRGSVGWASVAHLSLFWGNFIQNLPNFGSFGYSFSEEKIFFRNNQKQELPIVAMFFNGSGPNEQSL